MKNWIQAFYDAVDSNNYEKSLSYYADNVRSQFGNRPATTGKDALVRELDTIAGVTKGVRHQFLAVAETDDTKGKITMLEANVTYTRWNDQLVTLPCVTVLRHNSEKIQDLRLYMDITPLMSGPPAKLHASAVTRVNPPGQKPKLTRSDIWKALVTKSEDAARFVPAITSCVVVERENNGIIREALVNGMTIRERVTYEPEKRVLFVRIDSQEMGTVYNDIEEDENGELWIRLTSDLERADLPDGSPLAQRIEREMSVGYSELFERIIQEATKVATVR